MKRALPLVGCAVAVLLLGLAAPAHAVTIRGTGSGALLGFDVSDPHNNINDNVPTNPPYYGTGYDFVAAWASSENWFTPGGAFISNEAALDLFDNKVGSGETKWYGQSAPGYVTVQLARPIQLTHFTFSAANDAAGRDPDIWQIQGSNDNINWTTIYAYNNNGTSPFTARNQVLLYESPLGPSHLSAGAADFAAPGYYTYIRYSFTSTVDGSPHQINELEYFGNPIGFNFPHDLDLRPVFNADQIVNYTGGVLDTTQNGIDAGGLVYMTQSAATQIGGAAGTGLPDDGVFLNTALGFPVRLAYSNADNGNNALRLTDGGSASLLLGQQDCLQYGSLFLFATNGSGDGVLTVTLLYADGTTSAQAVTVDDWFNDGASEVAFGTQYLIDLLDRCAANGTGFQNSNDPAIFAIPLQADFTRQLVGITFARTGGAGVTTIFGVSGLRLPEPASLTLLAAGCLALWRRRRRAR